MKRTTNAQTQLLKLTPSLSRADQERDNYLGPISATPRLTCERLFNKNIMKLTKKSLLFDLGCNDARVLIEAAKKFKCKCVGIEIDRKQCAVAREKIIENFVEDFVEIREGDVFKNIEGIERASAVFLYLLPKGNKKVEEILRTRINDDCCVICYMFKLPEDVGNGFWRERMLNEVAFEDTRERSTKGVDASKYNRIFVYGSKNEMRRRNRVKNVLVRGSFLVAMTFLIDAVFFNR